MIGKQQTEGLLPACYGIVIRPTSCANVIPSRSSVCTRAISIPFAQCLSVGNGGVNLAGFFACVINSSDLNTGDHRRREVAVWVFVPPSIAVR